MKKKYLIILIVFFLTACKTKKYTITFNTNGGSLLESVTIEKGNVIKDIPKPTKEGYIFVNWLKDDIVYNENTPINEDITLTASWTEVPDLTKEYKVIFDNDGETNEVIVQGKSKVKQPKNPSKKYYNFIGWYESDKLYDFNQSVTKDLYLEAKYEKKIIKVTFDLNGGSGITEKQIEAGKQLTKPENPTKFGYNFIGWYYLGKEYNFESIIEKNINLIASWEPINYITVKFITDSDTEIKSQIIEKGNTIKIPDDPIKEGYDFKYWEYNNEKFDFTNLVNENITLYAKYELKKENEDTEN